MLRCSLLRTDVAQFVNVLLHSSRSDLLWTMNISPDVSVGFYAITVTGELSEDTVKKLERTCLEMPTSILEMNIPAG